MQLIQTDIFGQDIEVDITGKPVKQKKTKPPKEKKLTLKDATLFAKDNSVVIYSLKSETNKFLVRGEVSYSEKENYERFADSEYVRAYFENYLDNIDWEAEDDVIAKALIAHINEQNKPKKDITLKAAIKFARSNECEIWTTKDRGRFVWNCIAKYEEFPDSFLFATSNEVKQFFEPYECELNSEEEIKLLDEDDVIVYLINWVNTNNFSVIQNKSGISILSITPA